MFAPSKTAFIYLFFSLKTFTVCMLSEANVINHLPNFPSKAEVNVSFSTRCVEL